MKPISYVGKQRRRRRPARSVKTGWFKLIDGGYIMTIAFILDFARKIVGIGDLYDPVFVFFDLWFEGVK